MKINQILKKIIFFLLFTSIFVMCKPENEPDKPMDISSDSSQWKITSGRVNTYNTFSFQYGRMDVSVKLPQTANGLWPAIWLMGADYNGYSSDGTQISILQSNWPTCGEIDIVEMGAKEGITQGTQDRFLSRGTHWGAILTDYSHPSYCINSNYSIGLQDDFHLFTFVWDTSTIKMYINPSLDENLNLLSTNVSYYEMRIDVYNGDYPVGNYFHKPFFMIFNLAVGGDFSQIYDIGKITALNLENQYEANMYVDFVRVFDSEKKNTAFAEEGLIWQDHFEGKIIDETKWNIEENDYGGGNHELQTYTRNNVSIGVEPKTRKHCLILTAKKEKK